MPEYITDNRQVFSDSDREDSDEEISNEEDSDKENFDEENYVQNVFRNITLKEKHNYLYILLSQLDVL